MNKIFIFLLIFPFTVFSQNENEQNYINSLIQINNSLDNTYTTNRNAALYSAFEKEYTLNQKNIVEVEGKIVKYIFQNVSVGS